MKTFVLASNNQKKLNEVSHILSGFGLKFVSQQELGLFDGVVETGSTFAQNALLKARFAANELGFPAIADDSGLMVDALDGRPGIFSARYAEDDGQRISRLLSELQEIQEPQRTAKFVTATALVFPDGREFTVEGETKGLITSQPLGTDGFGYDPIFFVPEYSCTYAQMPQALKNQISHRAKSLEKLKNLIGDLYHDYQ